jgi:hypothetical protein
MENQVFSKFGEGIRVTVLNIVLVASAFVWYFLFFNFLRNTMDLLVLSSDAILKILGLNFFSLIFSALSGSFLVERFWDKVRFLYFWMLLGAFLSLSLLHGFSGLLDVLVLSVAFGAYFGFGMPVIMGYYASTTSVFNRSKIGGTIFLVISLCSFIFSIVIIGNPDILALLLMSIQLAGLFIFYMLKPKTVDMHEGTSVRFSSILLSRPFILYFLPWCMFSLVNYIVIPVLSKLFSEGEAFVRFYSMIENVLFAAFAFAGGFLADAFGRKRLAMIGFALVGFGYAILGLAQNIVGWYLYTVIDGTAWGIFFVLFFFTVWGDLAEGRSSEKYYAVGVMPYLFSNFMRLLLEPYVSLIPTTALFSFASVFLFAAVLPLVYAPETLPESVIRARQLKSYIEKAKKFKEKYS